MVKKVSYYKSMFKVMYAFVLYANFWSIATNQMISNKMYILYHY